MEISKTIISVIELVPNTITSILKELSTQGPLKEEDESDLRLILEEALVNAIKHGNDCNTSLKVWTKIKLENGLLTITVSDQGPGFGYHAIPDPLENPDALKESGRGIFLIKQLSDEVRFNESGSEITIIKKLRKGDKSR